MRPCLHRIHAFLHSPTHSLTQATFPQRTCDLTLGGPLDKYSQDCIFLVVQKPIHSHYLNLSQLLPLGTFQTFSLLPKAPYKQHIKPSTSDLPTSSYHQPPKVKFQHGESNCESHRGGTRRPLHQQSRLESQRPRLTRWHATALPLHGPPTGTSRHDLHLRIAPQRQKNTRWGNSKRAAPHRRLVKLRHSTSSQPSLLHRPPGVYEFLLLQHHIRSPRSSRSIRQSHAFAGNQPP